MLVTKKKTRKPITGDTAYDFDFIQYHDEAILAIINRFRKTQNMKRIDKRFESDYVFKESDAIEIIETCFRMNLPFEVSYKPCYDGCWEINFKILLDEKRAG